MQDLISNSPEMLKMDKKKRNFMDFAQRQIKDFFFEYTTSPNVKILTNRKMKIVRILSQLFYDNNKIFAFGTVSQEHPILQQLRVLEILHKYYIYIYIYIYM